MVEIKPQFKVTINIYPSCSIDHYTMMWRSDQESLLREYGESIRFKPCKVDLTTRHVHAWWATIRGDLPDLTIRAAACICHLVTTPKYTPHRAHTWQPFPSSPSNLWAAPPTTSQSGPTRDSRHLPVALCSVATRPPQRTSRRSEHSKRSSTRFTSFGYLLLPACD